MEQQLTGLLPREAQAKRAATWYGWRPAPNLHCCPRVFAGKQCRAWTQRADHNRCPCQTWHWTMLDHATRWRAADGEHILTGEPYTPPFNEGDLRVFEADLATLGLSVTSLGSARSPWNPTYTTLLVIRRAPWRHR